MSTDMETNHRKEKSLERASPLTVHTDFRVD